MHQTFTEQNIKKHAYYIKALYTFLADGQKSSMDFPFASVFFSGFTFCNRIVHITVSSYLTVHQSIAKKIVAFNLVRIYIVHSNLGI